MADIGRERPKFENFFMKKYKVDFASAPKRDCQNSKNNRHTSEILNFFDFFKKILMDLKSEKNDFWNGLKITSRGRMDLNRGALESLGLIESVNIKI